MHLVSSDAIKHSWRGAPWGTQRMNETPCPPVFRFSKGTGNFLRKWEAGGISAKECELFSQKDVGSNPASALTRDMSLGK